MGANQAHMGDAEWDWYSVRPLQGAPGVSTVLITAPESKDS